ncbi:MAG: PocR ligand-binding domain-containing protein [Eubacterium sp.]|nr:PocR ligand-binding domain-containing protein [Eubacterium sp.]
MKKFEQIISNWATATGMAAVAIGADGEYISEQYHFTEFCKMVRGCKEGGRRCEKCDKEANGLYRCHAGLYDFALELSIEGEKLGCVLGGQVLPEEPDEQECRRLAAEIGLNEESCLRALHKVKVSSEQVVQASVEILCDTMTHFIQSEYAKNRTRHMFTNLADGIKETNELIETIKKETGTLRSIQSRQKILALNASIEAARAGDLGAGFAVVASEVGKLSERSSVVNKNIEEVVNRISEVVSAMR